MKKQDGVLHIISTAPPPVISQECGGCASRWRTCFDYGITTFRFQKYSFWKLQVQGCSVSSFQFHYRETNSFDDGKFNNGILKTTAVVTRQRVATPTSTYEQRADAVKYRVQRYEPVTSPCQQVPDVWDRAQTRQMIDHVVGDSDYVQKVNEALPTGYVAIDRRRRVFSNHRYPPVFRTCN